jgi:hypothetical protein
MILENGILGKFHEIRSIRDKRTTGLPTEEEVSKMRINNQTPVGSNEINTSKTRADGAHSSVSSAAPSSIDSSVDYGMVPSSELLNLNSLLAQVPPLRSDAIAAAVRRLASGTIHTPSVMQQTANAMLGE